MTNHNAYIPHIFMLLILAYLAVQFVKAARSIIREQRKQEKR